MADRSRRMVQLAGAGTARYADDEVDETVAFLEWLLHENFIFLGYREYRFADSQIAVVPGSGLGILADTGSSSYAEPERSSTSGRNSMMTNPMTITSEPQRNVRIWLAPLR